MLLILAVSHQALSGEIENKVREPAKVRSKLQADFCDTVFSPSVQSGGKICLLTRLLRMNLFYDIVGRYDFKIGVEPDKNNLSFDTIIFSVGTI